MIPFAFMKSGAPVPTSTDRPYTRTQGSMLLTVNGSRFTGATSVTVGGTSCTSVTVVSDTGITCVTPAKAAGIYDLVVTGPGGNGTLTNGIEFVNPTSIFGANLKRWYSQQYSAPTWTDESGTANTSQATGTKQPTASTFASTTGRPTTHVALSFDGGDALSAGGDVELITTAGCIGCIFSTSSIGTNAALVAKLFDGSAYILGHLSAGGADTIAFSVNGETTTTAAISAGTYADGAVHRVIGTFLGHASNPTTTLYMNGSTEADTGTGGASVTDTADIVSIGAVCRNESTNSYFWNGKIGEVVIANVVPDATQRAKLNAYLRDCQGQ